jgi:hypothetical protein
MGIRARHLSEIRIVGGIEPCVRNAAVPIRETAKLSMAARRERRPPSRKSTKAKPELPPKLSNTEADLLWHMTHGYQLETSAMGDNPILRRLKDNTEVRATANRSTIETLHERGLIEVAEAGSVLKPTVWRLSKSQL